MPTTARIQNRGQVTIPTQVRSLAGLSKGDVVEFAFLRGKIVITPKVVIDRSDIPSADDDYTLAQRKQIDARLAEAEEDIRQGRVYGPFNTNTEFLKALHTESAKLTKKKIR